jgi:malonate decarboxylase alpha subunit
MFIDLTPKVALVCAERPMRTAISTPAPTPRTRRPSSKPPRFRHGIVIAQVNEIVDELPRVDIPGSWVDFVVLADKPFTVEPLFTRDPRHITELQVLMA